METTKTAEAKENNKGEIGMIPVILGLGLPMLLAAAGIYCTIEGKVNNDIASLFFAGIAMIGVAVVAILVACMFFSKHRTASDTCLNSLLCINTGTNCCELGCFAAAVTEME
jgi:heme/copper-type cytochrome/quinol oxidase subunit 4